MSRLFMRDVSSTLPREFWDEYMPANEERYFFSFFPARNLGSLRSKYRQKTQHRAKKKTHTHTPCAKTQGNISKKRRPGFQTLLTRYRTYLIGRSLNQLSLVFIYTRRVYLRVRTYLHPDMQLSSVIPDYVITRLRRAFFAANTR